MARNDLVRLADLNYIEALREQTRACGGTIIEEDGLVLLAGPGPHPILNYAVRLDASLAAGEAIGVMLDYFSAHEHSFTLVLRNGEDESDLARAAKSAGLIDLMSPPEMIVDKRLPDKPAPAGTELRPASDVSTFEDFRIVAADAWTTYGIPAEVTEEIFSSDAFLLVPHVEGVVCYDDEAPVSSALVLLSHGIGGVYWVSTSSVARGKGFGEACTRWVTNRAFDLGAQAVSLQASPMGLPIYKRMGYREAGAYRLLAMITPAI